MNTDDISFADFLAFNAPPVVKPEDPWKLHTYAFVPIGVEAALERIAKAHARAMATHLPGPKSALLLTGASVIQQRAAVRWLSERLDLPAFVVNAAELCDLAVSDLDALLAPLREDTPRLFVIRNVDALPFTVTARLVARRSPAVFVFATLDDAPTCRDDVRGGFRATIDWQAESREPLKRKRSTTFATLLGDCFGRLGLR